MSVVVHSKQVRIGRTGQCECGNQSFRNGKLRLVNGQEEHPLSPVSHSYLVVAADVHTPDMALSTAYGPALHPLMTQIYGNDITF
jgi:hypothetical protein